MKFFLTNFFSLIVICLISLNSKAQKIDPAPLDAYWNLIEPLKLGDSLSVKTWKEFLEIEPNKIYINNQAFNNSYLERLRKAIQVVYMPKYESVLTARIAAIKLDTASYWMTYKVYEYKKYEKELKAYEKELLDPAYIDSIYKNTFEWLPKRLQQKDTSVKIHLLGIENDAIAGDGIIIATLWQMYNQDKLKMAMLVGHEMHHVLRKPLNFKAVQDNDKGLIYVLNAILNEGSADMIDKVLNIAHDAELPLGVRYKNFELDGADSIVKVINQNILEMAQSGGLNFKTEKEYRNLVRWSSGHCPGYYMADIIVQNGYKKQLLKNIQNPFQFVYLYNKAAKKDAKKPPVFSKISINYVRMMEKKYYL